MIRFVFLLCSVIWYMGAVKEFLNGDSSQAAVSLSLGCMYFCTSFLFEPWASEKE